MSRKAYQIDLTDAEWQEIKPLLPVENSIGRPRQVNLREILNAIFYVLSEGCRAASAASRFSSLADSL